VADVDALRGRKLGEFILRERLGEGGFGAVYRCEQRALRREAVVKILHPRLRHNDVVLQRFLREAQVASRLDHPYAAHVYAFGIERDDGLFWIAMELVHGIALNRWLTDRGPLLLDVNYIHPRTTITSPHRPRWLNGRGSWSSWWSSSLSG
jgi:serine/threonine protein kinase